MRQYFIIHSHLTISHHYLYMKKLLFLLMLQASVYLSAQQLPSLYDASAVYDEASMLYNKSMYGEAKEKFTQYLQLTDEPRLMSENNLFANAAIFQAICAYHLHDDQAVTLMENCIEKYPEHSLVTRLYYYIGSYYFDHSNYKSMFQYFGIVDKSANKDAVLSSTEKEKLNFALGCYYLKEKDIQNSSAYFLSARKKGGIYNEDVNYYLASNAYITKDYETAYDGFSALESSPKYGKDLTNLMGYCLLMLGKYDALLELAKKSLSNPALTDPQIFLLAANASYEKEKYTDAITYFEAFTKAQKNLDRISQLRYGHCFYQKDEFKKAIPPLEKVAIGQDSISQAANYYLGFCYLKENRPTDATYAYKNASVSVKGSNPKLVEDASYQAAKLAFATQNYSEAKDALFKLKSNYPNAPFAGEVKEMLAEIFFYYQDYQGAIDFFAETPPSSKRSKLAYQTCLYYYGVEWLNKDNFDQAKTYFQKAIDYPQDNDLVLKSKFWLAESDFKRGQYTQAISNYNAYKASTGAKTHEYYGLANYGIGWSYLKLKNYDQAALSFDEFAKLPKNNISPLQEIDGTLRAGDCYFMKRDYVKSAKYYQSVVDKNFAQQDYALYQIAEGFYRQNKYDNSVANFDKIIRNYKSSDLRDNALDRISEIYYTWKKEPEKAKAYANILVNEYPRSPLAADGYNRLAQIAYEKEENTDAIKFYRKVLDDYTFDAENCRIALDNLSSLLEPDVFDVLLKNYRAKNPNVDDKLSDINLKTAEERFYAGNYTTAIELLTNVLSGNPGAKRFKALFIRGESYKNTTQNSLAFADYAAIYNETALNDYTAKALYAAASLQLKEKEYKNSLDLFKKLENSTQVSENKVNAKFGVAKSYVGLKDYANALYAYNQIEADNELDEETRDIARVGIGNAQFGMKKYEDALKTFQKVAAKTQDESGAESQYMVVRTLYAMAKYDASLEAGKFFRNNFPDSEWKDRAVIWMAENNIALKNLFQANSLLQNLINETQYPEIKAFAQKRLEEINK